jgi:3,4-dihydroxy 2-butanone 4-phosphate synthase/GTP cyclohydrolase II
MSFDRGTYFPCKPVKVACARAGHIEAGCDLTALAGLSPAAVICEIMNNDGTISRLPDLQKIALQHCLKIGKIAHLIEYRSRAEAQSECLI